MILKIVTKPKMNPSYRASQIQKANKHSLQNETQWEEVKWMHE